jgi:hypothetical protein
MPPDRILPTELMGMSAPTEKMRDQIVDYFREINLIEIDALGQETIHGIPVKEFISTERRVPASIIERCGGPEKN